MTINLVHQTLNITQSITVTRDIIITNKNCTEWEKKLSHIPRPTFTNNKIMNRALQDIAEKNFL